MVSLSRSLAISKTRSNDPTSLAPTIEIVNKPTNMMAPWNTSVHTTAFIPPYILTIVSIFYNYWKYLSNIKLSKFVISIVILNLKQTFCQIFIKLVDLKILCYTYLFIYISYIYIWHGSSPSFVFAMVLATPLSSFNQSLSPLIYSSTTFMRYMQTKNNFFYLKKGNY